MPEQRARQHHRDRVAETLRLEIGTMIAGELSDPRIALATVTDVVLAPGGKSARVYVAVDGTPEEEKSTLAGLEAAKGYVRFELKERMGVRHVPELTFHVDRSARVQSRIDSLLNREKRAPRSRQEAGR